MACCNVFIVCLEQQQKVSNEQLKSIKLINSLIPLTFNSGNERSSGRSSQRVSLLLHQTAVATFHSKKKWRWSLRKILTDLTQQDVSPFSINSTLIFKIHSTVPINVVPFEEDDSVLTSDVNFKRTIDRELSKYFSPCNQMASPHCNLEAEKTSSERDSTD